MSGQEACAILERHGFVRLRQRGSHIIMQRAIGQSTTTVPVPDHRELRLGTLRSIIRQSGVPAASLKAIECLKGSECVDGGA
jgi:predicted RNA binding protein YcfA (HicA-like mRNA interferase family)